jgi:hypothetical protein
MATHKEVVATQRVWYIDLGSSKHNIGKREVFSEFDNCKNEVIIVGNNIIHEVQGRGEIPMQV